MYSLNSVFHFFVFPPISLVLQVRQKFKLTSIELSYHAIQFYDTFQVPISPVSTPSQPAVNKPSGSGRRRKRYYQFNFWTRGGAGGGQEKITINELLRRQLLISPCKIFWLDLCSVWFLSGRSPLRCAEQATATAIVDTRYHLSVH